MDKDQGLKVGQLKIRSLPYLRAGERAARARMHVVGAGRGRKACIYPWLHVLHWPPTHPHPTPERRHAAVRHAAAV